MAERTPRHVTRYKASENKDNNSMLKRFIGCVFLFGLMTASAVSIVFYAEKNMPPTPAIRVETLPAYPKAWQETIQAVGSLSANQSTVIKAETSGRITALYFRSGDTVNAHAPLLQLNPDSLNAQLNASKAATALGKADYERALTLYKKKVFAKADLDKVSANYQINLAKQAQTQAASDQTLIRAPFSGRLGLSNVNVGDMIDPSTPITHLASINSLRVDFTVPGTEANKIAVGSKLLIHASAYPGEVFVGYVDALDSHIDNDTRSLSVRASLTHVDKKLLPGAFVDIQLAIGTPQTVFIVPETAVTTNENGCFVYRVIHHKAIKTPVSIRFHHEGEIGLLSNAIHPGDQIISVGSFKVHENSVVSCGK